MTDITSFVKLSPKEAVIDRWQVMRHREALPVEKFFTAAAVFVVMYVLLHFILGVLIGIYSHATGASELLYFWPFRLLRFLLEVGIPAAWVCYPLWLKPREEGQLALTNWRLLFVTQGSALRRSVVNVIGVNLTDVLGVHSVYSQTLLGRKKLKLIIHTRFRDGLAFETDHTPSWIGWVPVIGDPFARNAVTSDTIAMLPVLFNRIQERSRTTIGTSGSY